MIIAERQIITIKSLLHYMQFPTEKEKCTWWEQMLIEQQLRGKNMLFKNTLSAQYFYVKEYITHL